MISVIMPVYKTEYATLLRAVDSVRRQTFSDWELLLIDDNDRESLYFAEVSRLESEETDARVRFHRDGMNRGANVARNIGLATARGELIAFCDSDDAWAPGYLEFLSDFFGVHPEAVLLSASYRIRCGDAVREVRHCPRIEEIWRKEIYADQLSSTTAVSARRDALLSAGGFDESLEARQDYDMWLRACRLGPVGFTEKVFADIYQDGVGHERISGSYLRHIRATERVLEKILVEVPISLEGKVKAAHYGHMALAAIKSGDGVLARSYAKKMFTARKNLHSALLWGLCQSVGVFRLVASVRNYWLRH